MSLERELHELVGQMDAVVAAIDDMQLAGDSAEARENRTIHVARARLAREQAARTRRELRRVAARTSALAARAACIRTSGTGAENEPNPRDRREQPRTTSDPLHEARNALRTRHPSDADSVHDHLLRATCCDVPEATTGVLDGVEGPPVTCSVDHLGVLLGRVPRSQIKVRPLVVRATPHGSRRMVELNYQRDDLCSTRGVAELVAVQPPRGRAGTYEVIAAGAAPLEPYELTTAFGAGRGLRWVHPGDPRARLRWDDAEALVTAITDEWSAARVAAHLGCRLLHHHGNR